MANPFYVQPASPTQGLTGLLDTASEGLQQRKLEEKTQAIKEKAMAAFQSGDPRQIAEFMIQNPEVAETMNIWEAQQYFSDRTKESARDTRREFLMNPTEENARELMEARQRLMDEEGVPPERRVESMGALEAFRADPEGYLQDIEAEAAATDWEWYTQFDDRRRGVGEGGEPTTDIKNWELFKSLKNPEEKEQFGKAAGFIEKDANPSPTDIDDYVRDAELCRQGDQAACLRNMDRKGFKRAGPEEKAAGQLALDAAEAANVAADKIPKIRGYIDNLKEVKRLVDQGAGTGPIQGRLPTFRQASQELQNLRGQLGLNVIQSATFGALSEKELNFALDVALPDKLEGEELKDWVNRKIAAQQKLLDHAEDAVAYLSIPGNTRAGFIEYQKSKAAKELPKGWTEEEIQYNMGKYDMTRREVIEQIRKGSGQ